MSRQPDRLGDVEAILELKRTLNIPDGSTKPGLVIYTTIPQHPEELIFEGPKISTCSTFFENGKIRRIVFFLEIDAWSTIVAWYPQGAQRMPEDATTVPEISALQVYRSPESRRVGFGGVERLKRFFDTLPEPVNPEILKRQVSLEGILTQIQRPPLASLALFV